MPAGLWRGHVEASADDELPFDDRRFLAFSVAPPARVLVVDGDPGRALYESETYFLQAALRLAPPGEHYAKTPFDPQTVELAGGTGLPDLEKTEAVVLANVEKLGASDVKRLGDFVERGGGLLVFTGDRVRPEWARVLEAAGLGVGEVLENANATELPWRLERWDAEHPVFKPFADPEHGDLRRPAFTAITPIKPDQRCPRAGVVPGRRSPRSSSEPRARARSSGSPRHATVPGATGRAGGCTCRWSIKWSPMYAGLAEGGRIRQEVAGDDRKPGVVESDGLVHVVNADPSESETARCTPKEFADRFGFKLPVPAGPDVAAAECSRERRRSLAQRRDLALAGIDIARRAPGGKLSRQPDGGLM